MYLCTYVFDRSNWILPISVNQYDGTMKRSFENYSRLLLSAKMVLLFLIYAYVILKNEKERLKMYLKSLFAETKKRQMGRNFTKKFFSSYNRAVACH